MTAKFTAARREAFFRALARTGNQTLACEQAKVSRSWVTLHRSGDPEFRRRIEEAIAVAKVRLDAAPERRPEDKALRWQDGDELVVRGSNGRRTQIARSRLKQWSPRVETRFLAKLAASCNVKAACAEVGMTPASAYGHRNRWPAFQRRWDEALENGYVRLEGTLVENAANLYSREDYPLDHPLPDMTTAQAIHLLHMHKHGVLGIGKRPGRLAGPPDMDEVRKSILRKIEAIARLDEREAERKARREARKAQREGRQEAEGKAQGDEGAAEREGCDPVVGDCGCGRSGRGRA
jgi:hypothetical protein